MGSISEVAEASKKKTNRGDKLSTKVKADTVVMSPLDWQI
jgi:hypothetical protein